MKTGKLIMKKGVTLFRIKAKRGQELSEREAFELNENIVPGFLPFEYEKSGGGFTLTYNLSGLLTLREFLQFNIISERMLKKLLSGIFENLDIASKLYFNRNLIQMTVDTVLVNPANWHVYFIYVPIQPFETTGSLKEVLKSIVSFSTFNSREDTAYVEKYIAILNDGVNFSEFAIKEYVASLYDKSYKPSETYREDPLEKSDAEAMVDEPVKKAGIYDPLEEARREMQGADRKKISSPQRNYCLMDVKSGNIIPIKDDVIHIGKTYGYSDIYIDNPAVSRKHADIFKEAGECYVVDSGSTNGTYINGIRIQIGVKTKLIVNSELAFANEMYIFREM